VWRTHARQHSPKKAGEKLREKGLAFLDESLEHKKKR
jgi:hypothetical protein